MPWLTGLLWRALSVSTGLSLEAAKAKAEEEAKLWGWFLSTRCQNSQTSPGQGPSKKSRQVFRDPFQGALIRDAKSFGLSVPFQKVEKDKGDNSNPDISGLPFVTSSSETTTLYERRLHCFFKHSRRA